jgi:hypothetical protein
VIAEMKTDKEKIYLETSVISAYFDFKKQDYKLKRITRKFWRDVMNKFEMIISDVIITELNEITDEEGELFLNS